MSVYNPYPSIKLDYGEDNKWFYLLFEAILRVDISFITYKINVEYWEDTVEYKRAENDANNHMERVFAYEQYRQWANLMDQYGIKNLVLNGEIEKIVRSEIYSKKTKNSSKEVFPDLVLHHSHEDNKKQLMVCEIKRSRNLTGKKIFEDLHKLSCYLCEKIFWKNSFDYGFFIIVGKDSSLEKIANISGNTKSSFIDEYTFKKYKENKDFQKKFKNIVCASYNGNSLEYETLDQLLNKEKKQKRQK